MIAVVKCPQCGKTARFDPSNPAAGAKHLCVACGSVFNATAELRAGRGQVEAGVPQAGRADAISDRASPEIERLPAAAPHRRTGKKPEGVPLWAVAASGFLVLVAAAVMVAAVSRGGRTTVVRHVATAPATDAASEADDESDHAELSGTSASGESPVPPSSATAPSTVAEVPAPAEPLAPATRSSAPTTVAAAVPAAPQPSSAPTTTPSSQPAPGGGQPVRHLSVTRPPPVATEIPSLYDIDDEKIELAIKRGIANLAAQFDGRTKTLPGGAGENALAVYALLQAGLAVGDERLNARGQLGGAMLDGVSHSRPQRDVETYTLGVRCACLSLFARPQDRAVLAADVKALIDGHVDGAYGYDVAKGSGVVSRAAGHVDNSNSQYGVLGVWAATDAGIEVPNNYWRIIEKHWNTAQLQDGGWTYVEQYGGPHGARAGDSTVTMTSAGIASLFVVRDHLAMTQRDDKVGLRPFSLTLERGLAWLEGTHLQNIAQAGGYGMYGIERVGLASGFKYLGEVDWYRRIASQIVRTQDASGGWGSSVETSFRLLFLSRGRHPILFNKLRFDGYWANRPRDLAGVTPWVSKQLERPLNWQIVNLQSSPDDWLDAPVLYIASHLRPKFTDDDLAKLRKYAQSGGMIFTHTDGGWGVFDDYVTTLAHDLFPDYEYRELPPDHPLYNLVFKIDAKKVPLRAVSNGSRILMLHSKNELATHWQWRDYVQAPEAFKFAANLHVYAAGKRDLRNRLSSPAVPEVPESLAPVASIGVARVRYSGNWDPEPGAWTRFSRLLAYRTGTAAQVRPVKWAQLSVTDTPLAHLTGTARYVPTDNEVKAMKSYVEAGGVLLIDNCGGGPAFTGGVRDTLERTFGVPTPLAPSHPLLRGGPQGTTDLSPAVLRRYTMEVLKEKTPSMEVIYAGKGTVLISRLDIHSGLLGTGTWGVLGYAPKWCESFMQNLVFWIQDGRPTMNDSVESPTTAGAPKI